MEGFLEFLEANYYNRGALYEFLVWYTDNGGYPVGQEPDLDQELPDFFEGVQKQLEEWRETEAREQELRKAHNERAKGNTIRVRARLISPDARWFPDQEEEMVWHGYLPERGYFGFWRKEEAKLPREEIGRAHV